MTKLTRKIEEILKDNPRGMSIADISRKLDANRNTIAKYLTSMLSLGQVEMRPIGSAKLYFQSTRVPLAKLMDASSDVMVILDDDLIVVQANSKFCECIGVEKEAVIGLNFLDTPFCSVSTSDIKAQLKEVIHGENLITEMGFDGKTGFRYYSITLLPTVLGNGKPGVSMVADDITDHKMIEKSLFEKEVQYRTIVSSMQDMVFLLDKDNNLMKAPSFNEELFGFSEEEFIGKNLIDVLPHDMVDEILDEIEETRNTKKGSVLDFPLDILGKQYWFSGISTLHEDNKSIVIVLRDITERKKMEEALKESEMRYRSLVENIPQKVFYKDLDSVYICVNPAFAQELNLLPDDFEGTTDYDFHSKEHAEKFISDDKRIMSLGVPEEFDEEYIHKGEMRSVHTSKVPVKDTHGTVIGILGIFHDITERKIQEQLLKQSEEKFRTILEESPIGMDIFDAEGFFIHANRACIELFRIQDLEKYKGFNIFEDPNLTDEIKERIRKGETFRFENECDFDILNEMEAISTSESGIAIHDAVVAPLGIDEHGTPKGFLFQIQDITERKRAKVKITELNEFYQLILDSIMNGVIVTDKTDTITFVNNRMLEISDFSREHFEGHPIMDDLPERTLKVLGKEFLKAKRYLSPIRIDTIPILTPMGKETYQSGWFIPMVKDNQYDGMIAIIEDATDSIRAADNITKSSEFLMNVLEALHHPFYVIDVDNFTITMANNSSSFPSLSDDSTCYSLIHGIDKPCNGKDHPCPIEKVKMTKKSAMVEHVHYNEHNVARHVEIYAHPLLDDEGNVNAIIEYEIDITQRKKTEKALEESEKRYHELLDSATIGIGITNLDEILVYVNKTFANMLGFERDELEGENLMMILPPREVKKVLQETKKRIKGKSSTYHLDLFHKNGEIKNFLISAIPEMNQEGIVAGAFAYIIDVSKQNQTIRHLEGKLSMMKLIDHVATQLFLTSDLEQTMYQILAHITNVLGTEKTFLHIPDSEGTNTQCYEWSSPETKVGRKGIEGLLLNKSKWWRNLIKQGGAIDIPDISKMPKEGGSVKRRFVSMGLQSFIAYPLNLNIGTRGYFGAAKSDALAFSSDEYDVLRVCANIFSNVLELSRK